MHPNYLNQRGQFPQYFYPNYQYPFPNAQFVHPIYPQVDQWILEFNRRFEKPNKQLNKSIVVSSLQRMKYLLNEIEAFERNPVPQLQKQNIENQEEYKKLVSLFLKSESQSSESPQFTDEYIQFKKKEEKRKRKYKWRKRKREQYKLKKPKLEEENKKQEQKVNLWFKQKTKELQLERENNKKKKIEYLNKRKERKEIKLIRKQLGIIIPIFYERTKSNPERFTKLLNNIIKNTVKDEQKEKTSVIDRKLEDEYNTNCTVTGNMSTTIQTENTVLCSKNLYYYLPQIENSALLQVRKQWNYFAVPEQTQTITKYITEASAPFPPSESWKPFINFELCNNTTKK